ncbi:hypothetical protein DRW41_12295 [Neobacillus piezotolerans]|uniref:Uncharacterized protein n=1 Tax=Neobacillus piezotolerans TaxID=2259171 RepID=A0A3D8GRC2_9BACI|nr:hypothetical protein DRW41_12295 [Neobacillus piezotolerans]
MKFSAFSCCLYYIQRKKKIQRIFTIFVQHFLKSTAKFPLNIEWFILLKTFFRQFFFSFFNMIRKQEKKIQNMLNYLNINCRFLYEFIGILWFLKDKI